MTLPSGLRQEVVYAPGWLYLDPTAGAADVNASGYTYVGECTDDIILTYTIQKLQLKLPKYGEAPIDNRNIARDLVITIKLAQHNIYAKKLYWGDNLVTANGGVIIPGPDADNLGVSAPTHQFLYITKAARAGLTTEEAYYKNWYVMRGQAYPAQGNTQLFGNTLSPLEIDIHCTPMTEDTTKAYYTWRQFKMETIANITIATS